MTNQVEYVFSGVEQTVTSLRVKLGRDLSLREQERLGRRIQRTMADSKPREVAFLGSKVKARITRTAPGRVSIVGGKVTTEVKLN
jgi:hypothetical protein